MKTSPILPTVTLPIPYAPIDKSTNTLNLANFTKKLTVKHIVGLSQEWKIL